MAKQISKATVDILLVAGFFLSILTSRHSADSWGSLHCTVSMIWYGLILVHIWQHWRMTKALLKWKVLKRNVITTLTVVVFILMTISVIIFVGDLSYKTVHIHHKIAHIFWAVIVIHAITKTKRLISLFKNKKS